MARPALSNLFTTKSIVCIGCLLEKGVSDFYKRSGGDTYRRRCIKCFKIQSLGWRKTENGRKSYLKALRKWKKTIAGKEWLSAYHRKRMREPGYREKVYKRIGKYGRTGLGKANAARNRAKRRAAIKINSTLTNLEWSDILNKYDNSCAYCWEKGLKLTMDHSIPLCKGGHHVKENIVPACQSCNSKKGTKIVLMAAI